MHERKNKTKHFHDNMIFLTITNTYPNLYR